MGFSRQEYWSGLPCLFFLQGIFPTQGSNPGLLDCRQILYCLSLQESPREPVSLEKPCVSDHNLRPKPQMVALDTVGASDSLCLPRNAPAPLRQPAPLEKDGVPDVSLLFPPWRQSAPDPAGPGEAAHLDAYPRVQSAVPSYGVHQDRALRRHLPPPGAALLLPGRSFTSHPQTGHSSPPRCLFQTPPQPSLSHRVALSPPALPESYPIPLTLPDKTCHALNLYQCGHPIPPGNGDEISLHLY